MNKPKTFLALSVLSSAAILFGVAGCGSSEAEGPTTSARTQQQEIQDIQSNTHMPPSAKAAALASLQQGQAKAQQGAQSAKK